MCSRRVFMITLLCSTAVCATVLTNESLGDMIPSEMVATPLEKMTLCGHVGRKMDRLFERRICSDKAQGVIFEEAVNAFRTQWDDTHEPGRGDWQGEYWGKTMLGYVAAARYYDSRRLRNFVRERSLELIRGFQDEDGYLGTYRNKEFVGAIPPAAPWSVWTCNLWNRKYTIWGLLDAYRLTGDRDILAGCMRSMDQWIGMLHARGLDTRLTGSFTGLMSMSVLKPLLLLYGETGEFRYLDYAKELVRSWDLPGGFSESTMPNLVANAFTDVPLADWYPKPTEWAKAYEMMSCIEGLVEYARLTGDSRVFEATRRLQAKIADSELNAMGSVGHFDRFANAAKRPLAMSEACDVVHWMRVNKELFLITGESRYFDALEFCFYNAYLASVWRSGEWGAHMVRGEGRRHMACPPQTGMRLHQCCIDNAPRGFADFASVAVTADRNGAVCVNSYQDSVSTVGDVVVTVSGNYPFSDTVSIRVDPSRPFKLRLRVPGWCRKMTVSREEIPGVDKYDGRAVQDGCRYYEIDVPHDWTYVIKFEMPAEIVRRDIPDVSYPSVRTFSADRHEYAKWAVRRYEKPEDNPEMVDQTRGQVFANLRRGPLVLAKCKLVGATLEETLHNGTIDREDGWSCSLTPIPAHGTLGAWTAVFVNGKRSFSVNVSDFASAGDFDDATNWFSLNF